MREEVVIFQSADLKAEDKARLLAFYSDFGEAIQAEQARAHKHERGDPFLILCLSLSRFLNGVSMVSRLDIVSDKVRQ